MRSRPVQKQADSHRAPFDHSFSTSLRFARKIDKLKNRWWNSRIRSRIPMTKSKGFRQKQKLPRLNKKQFPLVFSSVSNNKYKCKFAQMMYFTLYNEKMLSSSLWWHTVSCNTNTIQLKNQTLNNVNCKQSHGVFENDWCIHGCMRAWPSWLEIILVGSKASVEHGGYLPCHFFRFYSLGPFRRIQHFRVIVI